MCAVKGDDMLTDGMLGGDLLETDADMVTRVEAEAFKGGLRDDAVYVSDVVTQDEVARAAETFEQQSKEVLGDLDGIISNTKLEAPDAMIGAGKTGCSAAYATLLDDVCKSVQAAAAPPGEALKGVIFADGQAPPESSDVSAMHSAPREGDVGYVVMAQLAATAATRELGSDASELQHPTAAAGDNRVAFGHTIPRTIPRTVVQVTGTSSAPVFVCCSEMSAMPRRILAEEKKAGKNEADAADGDAASAAKYQTAKGGRARAFFQAQGCHGMVQ
eukprot:7259994-Prymnesium_polylepis.2